MPDTITLEQKNLKAEIFSAPVVAQELERMWKEKRSSIREIAREIHQRNPRNLIFFGSGGSSSALYSGYWAGLSFLKLPCHYVLAPDLVAARPGILDAQSVAIAASYSGKTVDTLQAKGVVLENKAPLFAITRRSDAELAKGASWSVTYESIALYSSPAYLTMLLVIELARLRGESLSRADELEEALKSLPALLEKIYEPTREMAARLATQLEGGKLVVLSAGAAYTLGYMMAYDMFGEFLKDHCAYIHAGEFRHGPLETVRKGEPTMLFLVGNDASRQFSEAGIAFSRENGAKVVVFDARELAPGAHPLCDALILYISQLWLLYYRATNRGIDLDNYKYMHVVPYAATDSYY
jgi:fructoselysine 6-phosphate deglycase